MTHTKLPIISFLQKVIIFYCLIFKEFEKKFLNQEFYGQLPEQVWLKGSFDFSKIVPFGTPRSLIQMVSKQKGVFIEIDLLPTVITNSFKIKHLKNIFIFFLRWFYDHEIYSFLETSARFIMTKVSETQVHSFHTQTDIKAMFTFLKKHIHEWKHSWSKDKQKLPLVDPLS